MKPELKAKITLKVEETAAHLLFYPPPNPIQHLPKPHEPKEQSKNIEPNNVYPIFDEFQDDDEHSWIKHLLYLKGQPHDEGYCVLNTPAILAYCHEAHQHRH